MKESPPDLDLVEEYSHKPHSHGRLPLGSRQNGPSFTSVLLIKITTMCFYQTEAELYNRIPGKEM